MANQISVILTGKDQLSSTLNSVTKGPMRSMKRQALQLGGALTSAFAVHQIVSFGKESIEASAEATEVLSNLRTAVNNAGVSFSGIEDKLTSMAGQMELTAAVGDENMYEMLTRILNISGDVDSSVANVGLAFDIMQGTGRGATEVAEKLGKVLSGEVASLSDWGIRVETTEQALAELERRYGGMSENFAGKWAGQLKVIGLQWANFKQAIGDVFAAAAEGSSITERITELIQDMTRYVEENQEALVKWLNKIMDWVETAIDNIPTIIDLIKSLALALGTAGLVAALLKVIQTVKALGFSLTALQAAIGPAGWILLGISALTALIFSLRDYWGELGRAIKGIVDVVWNSIKLTTNAVAKFVIEAVIQMLEMVNKLIGGIGGLVEGIAGFFGKEIDTSGWTSSLDGLKEKSADLGQDMEENIESIRQGSSNTGDAFTDMWRKYRRGAEEAQTTPTPTPDVGTDSRGGTGGSGISIPKPEIDIDGPPDVLPVTAEVLEPVEDIKDRVPEALKEMYSRSMSIIQSQNGVIGEALMGGLQRAFDGEGITGFFKGFGQVIFQSLGNLMVRLGKTFLQFGKIFEFLRTMVTNIFTAPWALAAAGVALIALGTAISSAFSGQGAGGTGPIGGRGGLNSTSFRSSVGTMNGTGPTDNQSTTIIQVNGSKVFFDLDDPVQQKNFTGMFEAVLEGRKIKVQTA